MTELSLGELFSVSSTTFVLIFLAEFGDKSQLVCMTLAARHRPWPVLFGAVAAFAVLNVLAVVFGTVVAAWMPEFWLALIVAVLFGFFGIQSLLFDDSDDAESEVKASSSHGLFMMALIMIFVAEFGDKTQLAVAGMASSYHGGSVWLGSTLALLATTTLGVIAGQQLLKYVRLAVIHKISGLLFLLLAAVALYQAFG